jgi:hypothetical protein
MNIDNVFFAPTEFQYSFIIKKVMDTIVPSQLTYIGLLMMTAVSMNQSGQLSDDAFDAIDKERLDTLEYIYEQESYYKKSRAYQQFIRYCARAGLVVYGDGPAVKPAD